MTDKVKVSKWFDEWIKNNEKDKNKGVLKRKLTEEEFKKLKKKQRYYNANKGIRR